MYRRQLQPDDTKSVRGPRGSGNSDILSRNFLVFTYSNRNFLEWLDGWNLTWSCWSSFRGAAASALTSFRRSANMSGGLMAQREDTSLSCRLGNSGSLSLQHLTVVLWCNGENGPRRAESQTVSWFLKNGGGERGEGLGNANKNQLPRGQHEGQCWLVGIKLSWNKQTFNLIRTVLLASDWWAEPDSNPCSVGVLVPLPASKENAARATW